MLFLLAQISYFYLLSGSKVVQSKHDELHKLMPVKSATSGRIRTKQSNVSVSKHFSSGSNVKISKHKELQKLSKKSVNSARVSVSKDLASGSKHRENKQEPVKAVTSHTAVPKAESAQPL